MKKNKAKPLAKIIKEYKEGKYDVQEVVWGEPTDANIAIIVRSTGAYFSPAHAPHNLKSTLNIGDKLWRLNSILHREEGFAAWNGKVKKGTYCLRGVYLSKLYNEVI